MVDIEYINYNSLISNELDKILEYLFGGGWILAPSHSPLKKIF